MYIEQGIQLPRRRRGAKWRCSRRLRLEPVLLQPVAGMAIVAERDIIIVLGKYA